MADIALVTDSTADIPLEIREKYGISMVSLKVLFGNESYLDNIELSPAQFYEKQRSFAGLPTTSQPSPAEFYEHFKRLTDEGKTVISIHLSSALSGTYQSATIAKSMLDDENADVTVIDSRSASYGYGMLVVKAAEMASRGAGKDEIVAEVERLRRELRLFFLVDTLEFLQKGGRIGKASAVLGTLLNIKPILSIDDEGYVTPIEKVRGLKKAMGRIAELIETDLGRASLDVIVALTPGRDEGAKEMAALLKERLNVRSLLFTEIGPVIGTHAGPGTIGLFVTPAT
ncbi:DegV family protein [Cohnella faecalis]|uniref:DegV family protein n=1 Tax=Cohnella faecalis TaxID=2315694 RepID=A0A398CYU3_9BACL|nr:DegV family protein [Cohnella faecalis]RIE04401.1 DegV family protein [Cohnella faecalis]